MGIFDRRGVSRGAGAGIIISRVGGSRVVAGGEDDRVIESRRNTQYTGAYRVKGTEKETKLKPACLSKSNQNEYILMSNTSSSIINGKLLKNSKQDINVPIKLSTGCGECLSSVSPVAS